ncbi:dihydroneopterin aldolase [Nitrosophilus kaiyonis]|uniref:dihydroneopterin aldolase n=1 Tax=Nitrosophilus kaiyonis TaxID=2930200 RepID=UPI002491F160|nr:dihydroneopterin aldolase [Nitrosophilus kaiyonis]
MKITIENLEFYAIIGILEKEKEIPQKIVMNFYIDYDYQNDYIDYAEIVNFSKKFIKKGKFEIIEDALILLSKNLKTKFPQIKKVKISLKKPQILPDCIVGIEYNKEY